MGFLQRKKNRFSGPLLFLCLVPFLMLPACGFYTPRHYTSYQTRKGITRLGYSIQAGAFTDVDNAAQLAESLRREGIDAYYFLSGGKLYKVRFGDYISEKMALWQAEKLRAAGIIGECYIVGPRDYAATNEERYGALYLRDEIVKTAKNFLDVPYRWGGTSAEDGFDCSGLTMAVYEYNGLKIPRSSKEQFRAGSPVRRSDLLKGDLIFFATSHRRKVSHVGIYIGNNEFIHAPGRGETIRIDSLSNDYYDEHYVGARRFL